MTRVEHVHLTTDLQTIYINLLIRVIVKQETKQKRNEAKQAETKRNETKQDKAETKRNEIQQKRNETKKNHQ